MSVIDDTSIYQALVIPNEALDKGGVEILRAGLVADELYVTARPAFDDPAMWGEVLGDIAQKLARMFAGDGKLTHKQALAAIGSAFAAALGAPVVSERPKRPPGRKSARKSAGKSRTSARANAAKRAARRVKTTAKRKAR
jgi:hypothetical protein